MSLPRHPKTSPPGFTLIELLVAITIIAILFVIGLLVYESVQRNARVSRRMQDLTLLQNTLQAYFNNTGKYPIHTSADCIANNLTELTNGQYLTSLPADPSGSPNCYMYQSDPTGFDYKIRTSIADGDMAAPDFLLQPKLIDPTRDGGDSCKVDGTTPTAWAIYTAGACGY